ncbi:MAG TPA: carboxypeptidase-like regulatory domain-containing protein, partial [Candidatus Phocaeicola gallinarum]|nr:carboxypeptidase-like regulatory domain-containing protein [Candidatus Phocaeicola gallinarum]
MKTLRKYLPNNFSLFLLVCSLVCFPSWVMAQTIKLSGMVTDESRNPLDYANVVCLNGDSAYVGGGITDNFGRFSIELDTAIHSIRISKIGYVSRTFSKPFSTQFILATDNQLLKEVT